MYIDWDGQKVRLLLRLYFLLVTLLIGVTGDQCRQTWNKLALARRRAVPIHFTTGWNAGFTFFRSFVDLRRIPGGAVAGSLMLVMTFLAPLADLAVSGLVVNTEVQSRCNFGQGMIVNVEDSFNVSGPPWNGLPASVATAAQAVSLQNGGLQGIYNKVNMNINFSAEAEDVLSGWTCTVIGQDISFDAGSDPMDMTNALIQQGYQYDMPAFESQGIGEGYEHFVAWSASPNNGTFGVRASVDLNGQNTDAFDMRTFDCEVDGDVVDGIMAVLNTTWILGDWVQVFQGVCYDGSGTPARSDVSSAIEQILNTMVMVAGGHNYLLGTPDADSDPTQGCIVMQAYVPAIIFVLIAVFALILGVVLASWFVAFSAMLKAKGPHGGNTSKALDMLPNGLTSWMLFASRESALPIRNEEAPAKTSALKTWNVDWVDGMVRLSGPGLGYEHGEVVHSEEQPKGVLNLSA